MVSRVEIVLGVTILLFIGQEIPMESVLAHKVSKDEQKTLELYDTTFYEVNQSQLQHIIQTDHMVVYPNRTHFQELNLTTNTLTLIAKEAVLRGDIIAFEQNTTVRKFDGTEYHAKSVRYDRRQRVLVLPEHFSIKGQRGDVMGTDLEYQSSEGVLRGKKIDASYEMK
jgi:hypothetical protein